MRWATASEQAPAAPADAAAADPAKPQVAKDTSRAARCKDAQARLKLLEGDQALNVDRGDGKPVALEGQERKTELDVVRATAAAVCSDENAS